MIATGSADSSSCQQVLLRMTLTQQMRESHLRPPSHSLDFDFGDGQTTVTSVLPQLSSFSSHLCGKELSMRVKGLPFMHFFSVRFSADQGGY